MVDPGLHPRASVIELANSAVRIAEQMSNDIEGNKHSFNTWRSRAAQSPRGFMHLGRMPNGIKLAFGVDDRRYFYEKEPTLQNEIILLHKSLETVIYCMERQLAATESLKTEGILVLQNQLEEMKSHKMALQEQLEQQRLATKEQMQDAHRARKTARVAILLTLASLVVALLALLRDAFNINIF